MSARNVATSCDRVLWQVGKRPNVRQFALLLVLWLEGLNSGGGQAPELFPTATNQTHEVSGRGGGFSKQMGVQSLVIFLGTTQLTVKHLEKFALGLPEPLNSTLVPRYCEAGCIPLQLQVGELFSLSNVPPEKILAGNLVPFRS